MWKVEHTEALLMAAAYKGEPNFLELLLDQGADINASGCPFGNAIQGAIANDKVFVVELLLSRGAETNITEELLKNVQKNWSKLFAERLRHFDPKTGIHHSHLRRMGSCPI
jgi:ankyrin repeat protein